MATNKQATEPTPAELADWLRQYKQLLAPNNDKARDRLGQAAAHLRRLAEVEADANAREHEWTATAIDNKQLQARVAELEAEAEWRPWPPPDATNMVIVARQGEEHSSDAIGKLAGMKWRQNLHSEWTHWRPMPRGPE